MHKSPRGFSCRGLSAAHVLPVGVYDQQAEFPVPHARGTEGLHEVALTHPGRGKNTHVLGEDFCRDTHGHVPDHILAAPHVPYLDLAHLFCEERKILRIRVSDVGELGRDCPWLVEFSAIVHEPEGDSVYCNEYILAKTVELFCIHSRVPPGIGEVTVVGKIGYLCKKREIFRGVGDLLDIAYIQGCIVGCNETVRKDTPPDQPVLAKVSRFSIVQIHHGNLRTGFHRSVV